MAVGKAEVVSVRVESPIQSALQEAADREMHSLANMLEVMTMACCSSDFPLLGVPEMALSNATRPKAT